MRGANPHSHADLLSRYLVFCALQKIRQLKHRLRARCDAEFRQHVGNVMFYRAFGSVQSSGDRGVGHALAQQLGDFVLAPREAYEVIARVRIRAAFDTADSKRAHPVARDCGCPLGTESGKSGQGRAHLFCIAQGKDHCVTRKDRLTLPFGGRSGTIPRQLVLASR